MNFIQLLPARARVILTALPTYLAFAITAITVFSEELFRLLPDHAAATLAGWAAVVVSWLAGVIMVIQRLTPVPPSQRGLLAPPDRSTRQTPNFDRGIATRVALAGGMFVGVIVTLVVAAIAFVWA